MNAETGSGEDQPFAGRGSLPLDNEPSFMRTTRSSFLSDQPCPVAGKVLSPKRRKRRGLERWGWGGNCRWGQLVRARARGGERRGGEGERIGGAVAAGWAGEDEVAGM
jgi:hypothetical protein